MNLGVALVIGVILFIAIVPFTIGWASALAARLMAFLR
jgi:FlaG/FlaF family flagellin (archaellin)